MTVNKAAVATWVLYASVGLNTATIAIDLWHGDYAAAALQSVVIVAITTWLAIAPKLMARLDVRLAEAVAQHETANAILREVQRMERAGELRFGVTASMSSSARTH